MATHRPSSSVFAHADPVQGPARRTVTGIVQITRPEQAGAFDGMDFSPEGIAKRSEQGYAETARALAA